MRQIEHDAVADAADRGGAIEISRCIDQWTGFGISAITAPPVKSRGRRV